MEVQHQLNMAEKELEKKFSQTGAYKNLKKMLSWNGALEEPAKYPRFCPGQQISLTIVKAILGSIEELKPDASITGSVKNLLSREPSTKM